MLSVFLWLAQTSQPGTRPAFLDSFRTIHVPLDRPETPAEISGTVKVTVGGSIWPIRSIGPAGEAVRERRLPRTPGRVALPGNFQTALGGSDWNPDGEETQMREVTPGVFELVVTLPKGSYEYKIARNGSWDENYGAGFKAGGSNFHIAVPAKEPVKFVVDFNRKSLHESIDDPTQVEAPSSAPNTAADPSRLKYTVAEVVLAAPVPSSAIDRDIEVKLAGQSLRRVFARDVLDTSSFAYGGPLGAEWTRVQTTFRVWSPVSSSASVLLFDSATGSSRRKVSMVKARNGLWSVRVAGNLNGRYYLYDFRSYGEERMTPDISCQSASYGSSRSQIVDLGATDPASWQKRPTEAMTNPVDAVIYELSVRDLTVSPTSGVDPAKRGKYAGLGQTGTTTPISHIPTGIDYLKRLGVTHLHLLPIQDFLASSRNEYSWGYATCLFDVPEETYAVNPLNRLSAIREVKQMVGSVHRAGLKVVMDVVYNHTWPPQGSGSPFSQTVPYYYFRTDLAGHLLNESGVGNAFDDDRPMARKYVGDSLLYWQREFGIDGFRFDLLGMFDKSSVEAWSKALHQRDPGVLLYGEPWTGGGPTRFGKGTQRGLGIAVFNDDFRNLLRGDLDGSAPGFATGGGADPTALERALTGTTQEGGFAAAPSESINYVSAHDNLTLYDRLKKSTSSESDLLAALRLSCAAVLLSQGVPFLEGGAELGRTKGGSNNSYNLGDAVNEFDWERAAHFQSTANYLAALIALRKSEPGLRLRTAGEIKKRIKFLGLNRNFAAFTVDQSGLGAKHTHLLVALNGSSLDRSLTLPSGQWRLLLNGRQAFVETRLLPSGSVLVPPMSACVAAY